MADITKNGDETTVHLKLTQAGVSDSFMMWVPLYIEFADKRVILLGHATMQGSKTVDQTISLGKLKTQPTRIVANYNYDLLSD